MVARSTVAQSVGRCDRRSWRRFQRQVARSDQTALAENRSTSEHVVQFPDISRPPVVKQCVARFMGESRRWPSERLRNLLKKGIAEGKYVARPFAQRRECDLEHLQSVEQIFRMSPRATACRRLRFVAAISRTFVVNCFVPPNR
jgi:hypothetical protein